MKGERTLKNRNIGVIGYGMTPFNDHFDLSLQDLGRAAIVEALDFCSLSKKDIGALYVGNMCAEFVMEQGNIGSLIASSVDLDCPSLRVEASNASGAAAFKQACLSLNSGESEVALVLGIDKISDLINKPTLKTAVGSGCDNKWEISNGATIASLYALMARAHIDRYQTTEEDLALVAIKNHKNGSLNPNAQFRREISIERILKAKADATPLNQMHSAAYSDGAAAIIIATEEYIRESGHEAIRLIGSGQGHSSLALHDRSSIVEFESTKIAANQAYSKAKIKPDNIDFAEVHDLFTICEIIASEDLGFFKKGEGVLGIREGHTELSGRIPLNPSGGLKGMGHPPGASGVAQIIEVYQQFAGSCGKRQVNNPSYGLTHSLGGTGGCSYVNIFERLER